MKMIKHSKNRKKRYELPDIKLIKMDNEISLALESPPSGPSESIASHNNPSPFKT
ncbi:MAG: hypothetical protein H6Q20_1068 [Bacteroidetes bacterium]|nr:hypothetical protein [Bacteroidota bacterium]